MGPSELARFFESEHFVERARQIPFSQMAVNAVSEVSDVVAVTPPVDEHCRAVVRLGRGDDFSTPFAIAVVLEYDLGGETGFEEVLDVQVRQEDVIGG